MGDCFPNCHPVGQPPGNHTILGLFAVVLVALVLYQLLFKSGGKKGGK